MDRALAALENVDFDWTTHVDSIWRNLAYDTPEVQKTIRDEVLRLAGNVLGGAAAASPLSIAVLGSGGAGKTHMLSALRKATLDRGSFFVLVDMTDVHDFWETVLLGYIRSLGQRLGDGQTQHERFVDALSKLGGAAGVDSKTLRTQRPPKLINTCNTLIAGLRRAFPEIREHQDAVRAILLLESDDLDLQDLGYKWLQGIGVDEDERLHHGFHESRRQPMEIVRGLSYLMSLTSPTVLALDQLDAIVAEQQLASQGPSVELTDEGPAASSAARAIIQGIAKGLSALRDVTRRTLTVLSCLEQTWNVLDQRVVVTMVGRFRPPLTLKPVSDPVIAQHLVANRLSAAYNAEGYSPAYPTYPFPQTFFANLAGASPREVLKKCHEHRMECQRAGVIVEAGRRLATLPSIPQQPPPFAELCQQAQVDRLLDAGDDDALDPLLEAACTALVIENPVGDDLDAQVDYDFIGAGKYMPLHARIRLISHAQNGREKHFSVRFLEKTHHRTFQAQLKAAMTASGVDHDLAFRKLVIFRVGPVPAGEATSKLIEELKSRGGQIVRPSHDELSQLWALTRLVRDKPATPAIRDWLMKERIVSRMASFAPVVRYLFEKKPSATVHAVSAAGPVANSRLAGPSVTPTSQAGLLVGTRLIGDARKEPVRVPLENLVKHTAIFAGAGSGKTVLVRRLIEEAALAGVPSIVVDGANDLSRLGEPWPNAAEVLGPEDKQRADAYAEAVEVVVWTPGRQKGNPLFLDPLPRFADVKDDPEAFDSAIAMARASLEPIVELKGAAAKAKRGLLASTLRYFAKGGGATLAELVAILKDLPPEVGTEYENAEKHARAFADAFRAEMETNPLLRGAGAALDPSVLLRSSKPGKVRVSVINLSGLPDQGAQQQFVNQLAMTLFTWVKKNPPKGRVLQALLVIDEARDFMPSSKSVPSKESLMRLAAQGRKYGLGIVFATQAPKSIDHSAVANCSTHFYGKAGSPESIKIIEEAIKRRGGNGNDVASLPKGRFYAFTEGFQAPVKIQTNLCLSHHPASPPDDEEILLMAAHSRI